MTGVWPSPLRSMPRKDVRVYHTTNTPTVATPTYAPTVTHLHPQQHLALVYGGQSLGDACPFNKKCFSLPTLLKLTSCDY